MQHTLPGAGGGHPGVMVGHLAVRGVQGPRVLTEGGRAWVLLPGQRLITDHVSRLVSSVT